MSLSYRARFLRAFCLTAAVSTPLIASCTGDTIPAPGSIMVSITTDMQARKDIDQIGLLVTSNGKVIFDEVQGIAPQIYFPTTTALIGSRDEAKPVHIRIYAFQKGSSRILRQAITTVPKDRAVLLRLPVEWVNDGSAVGKLAASLLLKDSIDAKEGDFPAPIAPTVVSKCGANETMIGGVCTSAVIDSSTLPEYTEAAVFGSGSADTGGTCYDVKSCFSAATPIALDNTCIGAGIPGAAYAVRSPEGGDGDCLAGVGCFVPLPATSITTTPDGKVQLSPALCAKRVPPGASAPAFELVATTTCAPHDTSLQVCGDATRSGAQPSNGFLDGGTINVGTDAAVQPDGKGGGEDATRPPPPDGDPGGFDANIPPSGFGPPDTLPPDGNCTPDLLTITDGKAVYTCDEGNGNFAIHYRSVPVAAVFPPPQVVTSLFPGRPSALASNRTSGRFAFINGASIQTGGVFSGFDAGVVGYNNLLTGESYAPGLATRGNNVYFIDIAGIPSFCDMSVTPCLSPLAIGQGGPDGGVPPIADAITVAPDGTAYVLASGSGSLLRCPAAGACELFATGQPAVFPSAIALNSSYVYWYVAPTASQTGTVYRYPIKAAAGGPAEQLLNNLIPANAFLAADAGPPQGVPEAYLAADEFYVYYVAGSSIFAVAANAPKGLPEFVAGEPPDAQISALVADGQYIWWTNKTAKAIRRSRAFANP